jgi:hypothetical protein
MKAMKQQIERLISSDLGTTIARDKSPPSRFNSSSSHSTEIEIKSTNQVKQARAERLVPSRRNNRHAIKSPSKFKALTLPKMKSCQKRKRMCQCAEPLLPRWWGEDEGGREEREGGRSGARRERDMRKRALTAYRSRCRSRGNA